MTHIRSEWEVKKIHAACRLAAQAMEAAQNEIRPGVTTLMISEKTREFIESEGGKSAFLGYHGFPGATCISLNNEVVHGIPGNLALREGDIVKIDLGTYIDGFYGDMARTFPVGEISQKAADLLKATEYSLYEGIRQAITGNHVGDIGYAVQQYAEKRGYSVVRALVGHGIGRNLHEDPQVPNFGMPGKGTILKTGMVLAIEPMINAGTFDVNTLNDNWTVVTSDGKLSSHFENTCVVRNDFPEILTLMDGELEWQKTIQ